MTMLTAALRYAQHGWPVFPCTAGKEPMTRRGFHDATCDRATIDRWFGKVWPDANVAVRTGAVSGLVVLDVDGDDGAESLRRLERKHGPLPRTASVVTPRGGSHYYLRHPEADVRCSAGTLATGIDVRGDGGYVLAPPSAGANGRAYATDEHAPVAPMPEWLLKRLSGPQNRSQRTPVSEWLDLLREIPTGRRNQSVARLTGHLLRHYIDVDVTTALIHLVNETRCHPPLDRAEVDAILDSIAGREADRRARGIT